MTLRRPCPKFGWQGHTSIELPQWYVEAGLKLGDLVTIRALGKDQWQGEVIEPVEYTLQSKSCIRCRITMVNIPNVVNPVGYEGDWGVDRLVKI